MNAGLIFGVIVILIGLSLFLKAIGVNLPIVKILFGAFLIFIGVKIIIGGSICKKNCKSGNEMNVMFGESRFEGTQTLPNKFNVAFGKGEYDFSKVDLSQGNATVELNVAFGAADVKIGNIPCVVTANSAFGEVTLPNGNKANFGSVNYNSAPDSAGNMLEIKANVAFGAIQMN